MKTSFTLNFIAIILCVLSGELNAGITYQKNKMHSSPGMADLGIICPANQTEASCQNQTAVNAKFNTWLNSVSTTGGCNVGLSNNNSGAPLACGGSTTVFFTAISSCDPPATCSAVFSVTNAPAITLSCPSSQTENACQTQSVIDAKFFNWLQTATYTGGCNATLKNNNNGTPPVCGGNKTVYFTVRSTCEPDVTCSSIFSVMPAPAVVLNCPGIVILSSCKTQSSVDSAYAAWLTSVSFSGGCKASLSSDSGASPSACGGSVTVEWTVNSLCQTNVTCTSKFMVANAPPINLNCPPHQTENAGQSQAEIDAKFATWLNLAHFSGGCLTSLSNNNSGAPPNTGGSTTVMWTVTSSCEAPNTCSAYFAVKSASASSDPGLFEQIILRMDYLNRRAWVHTSFAQRRAYSMRLYNTRGQVVWCNSA